MAIWIRLVAVRKGDMESPRGYDNVESGPWWNIRSSRSESYCRGLNLGKGQMVVPVTEKKPGGNPRGEAQYAAGVSV